MMLERIQNRPHAVNIALVGKYVGLHDAYLSVVEALRHGGYENESHVKIHWIESEDITSQTVKALLSDMDGIVVPGGSGNCGVEGMIEASYYAREHKIPYFGICLGMQVAVIEFARHVLHFQDANSYEFDKTTNHTVIDLMDEQQGIDNEGGTMRLGAYPCVVKPGSKLSDCYQQSCIQERHRHRYECNNA